MRVVGVGECMPIGEISLDDTIASQKYCYDNLGKPRNVPSVDFIATGCELCIIYNYQK